MRRSSLLAMVLALAILSAPAAFAAAACHQSVSEAQQTYKDVFEKVTKMRRLHQARQMVSLKDQNVLNRDLKTVKAMVAQASKLCDRKRDSASVSKAKQAIALAKSVEARHVKLMKAGMAPKDGKVAKTGSTQMGAMQMGAESPKKQ
jgi:hypothetical protein